MDKKENDSKAIATMKVTVDELTKENKRLISILSALYSLLQEFGNEEEESDEEEEEDKDEK